jgi:hypothetical protein
VKLPLEGIFPAHELLSAEKFAAFACNRWHACTVHPPASLLFTYQSEQLFVGGRTFLGREDETKPFLVGVPSCGLNMGSGRTLV